MNDVTQEHKEQLSDLIYEWAKQRDYLPACFKIEMVEEIDIRSFEEVAE